MSEKNDQAREIGRVRRMLRELSQLAEEATLTGSMSDGGRAAARRYNSMLTWLEGAGAVPGGLFAPLGEQIGFGELAVEARMLSSYLKDAEEQATPPPLAGHRHERAVDFGAIVGLAPFLDQADLAQLVRGAINEGKVVDPGMLAGLAPFLDRSDLGRIVRENMPRWSEGPHPPHPPHPPHAPHVPPVQHAPHVPEPPEPPEEPEAPEPPEPPEPAEMVHLPDFGSVSQRLAEVTGRIETIAERMRQGDLGDQELAALAQEMARLAGEQADMARSLAP